MKSIFNSIFLVLLLIGTSSCSEDETSQLKAEDPSNLTLEVVLSEDNSGRVDVIAKADNATEFEIDLGESGTELVTDADGLYTHTYEITGVYTIEVKVFGNSGKFLRKTTQISIQVGESTGPIDTENGYLTPLSYEGMTLLWQDEFNGTSLNESDWNYEIGTGSNGWGNNELQYYRKENTSVSSGFLTIEAKKENFEGKSYTSSRLTTQDKFDFTYGRIDIRAQLPKGQGIWPALWMLGANFSTVRWPACGEIDIMEMVGGGEGRDDTVHGTLHWDNNGSYACTCEQDNKYQLNSGLFADKFHVFTIVWDSSSIKWYVDDNLYKTVSITTGSMSEFKNNFFFIFNVAVGGNWPGSPNASTVFPQKMIVDYVRVFQE